MKVTNEQAKIDSICGMHCPTCDISRTKPDEWHCTWGEISVNEYANDLLESRAQNAELLAALKDIANPIIKIAEEAKRDGYTLNGSSALSLTKDAEYLKSIARAAIAKLEADK